MFISAFPSVLTVSQNAFKTIKVNVEKAMALAEINLQKATALSITQFNFNFDVLEKLSPASDSFVSVASNDQAIRFGFMKSWDGIENRKCILVICDEADYERMLVSPIAPMKTLRQYDAVAWDAEPLPMASRDKAASSAIAH